MLSFVHGLSSSRGRAGGAAAARSAISTVQRNTRRHRHVFGRTTAAPLSLTARTRSGAIRSRTLRRRLVSPLGSCRTDSAGTAAVHAGGGGSRTQLTHRWGVASTPAPAVPLPESISDAAAVQGGAWRRNADHADAASAAATAVVGEGRRRAWTSAAALLSATVLTTAAVTAAAGAQASSVEEHEGWNPATTAAFISCRPVAGTTATALAKPEGEELPSVKTRVDVAAAAATTCSLAHDEAGMLGLHDGDGRGGGGGMGEGVSECTSGSGRMSTIADGGLFGQYEIGRLLGEGSFGLVYEARPAGTETRVALKQISKGGVRREEILQEISTLRAIHAAGGHENIARVLDVFEDPNFFFFVLELVSGGEMFEHLTLNGPYSEATAAGFMRELSAALQFLHKEDIIHADLKPENLMLSSWDLGDSKLKVVDFGSSLRVGTEVDLSNSTLGTTWYLPPEAVWERKPPLSPCSSPILGDTAGWDFNDDGGGGGGGGGREDKETGVHHLLAATPALDMWAVGCILFIMLCGAHPFDLESTASEAEVVKRVRAGIVPLHELGSGVSDSAKDLIARLLTKNPQERLTAEGMMRHPWIQGRTAPARPLEGSDSRLARFRELLSQKLETGVVSLLVEGAVAEGNSNRDEYTFNPRGARINTTSFSTSRSGYSNNSSHGYDDKAHAGTANVYSSSSSSSSSSNNNNSDGNTISDGGQEGEWGLRGVGQAVDVVKNAYRAFDRRGKGRVSAKDIAGFLEEHSATVSNEERRAIDEAVSVARKFRHRFGRKLGLAHNVVCGCNAPTNGVSDSSSSGGIAAKVYGVPKAVEEMEAPAQTPPAVNSIPGTVDETGVVVLSKDEMEGGTATTMTSSSLSSLSSLSLVEEELRAAASAGSSPESSAASGEMEQGVGGEEAGLDMSDFEDLLLDHLKTNDYKAGEFIFREGDTPDGGLYFILEGHVDVLVDSEAWDGGERDTAASATSPRGSSTVDPQQQRRAHTRVASMGPGDFFGEGGVVSSQPRGESVRAATPVKVINVSLASCHRMIDAPGKVSSSLRRVALSRALFRAKNVVRAVHSVARRRLGPGETVFRQGERGASLFTVEEGELDVVKEHSGVCRTVARLSPGSFFGEMALMTDQPRSASVVCAQGCGGGCVVEEVSGDDFARLLMARRTGFRRDVMRMLRARQFRHGVYKLLTELGAEATFSDQELRQVFDRVDTTGTGTLSLTELKAALCRADPLLHESAVEEIMAMLDLEATGYVTFEEFLKTIRWDP